MKFTQIENIKGKEKFIQDIIKSDLFLKRYDTKKETYNLEYFINYYFGNSYDIKTKMICRKYGRFEVFSFHNNYANFIGVYKNNELMYLDLYEDKDYYDYYSDETPKKYYCEYVNNTLILSIWDYDITTMLFKDDIITVEMEELL